MKDKTFAAALRIGVGACALTLLIARDNLAAENMTSHHSAVLVELFTSEGCSSCPPADSVLEALDRSQPVPGAEAVVLSEHVDYWNNAGWSDPYSSPRYSERQQVYAGRFRVESVYTPQMVVDGSTEFVGSDARRARASIQQAAQSQKATVRLMPLERNSGQTLRVQVQVDALPASVNAIEADVYLAVAENEATSQVRGGENEGHRLHHVAVVRSLKLLGRISPRATFIKEVPIGLDNHTSASQLRLVAFIQERGQGRVLGAAMRATASPELFRR